MTNQTAATPAAYKPTTGAHKPTIDALWRDFRAAIDAAYAGKVDHNDPINVLRDYARNIGWTDAIARLLAGEEADERQHQKARPASVAGPRISVPHRAMILILHAAGKGATLAALPPATDWMVYRRCYVEAEILGFLIRAHVTPEWVAACTALDYADAVK